MKNLFISYVFVCLLMSCSDISDYNSSEISDAIPAQSKNEIISAENKSNPHDNRGQQYFDLVLKHQSQNEYPNSIPQLADQLKYILSQIKKNSNTERSVIVFNDSIVESIMTDPDNSMISIVQSSDLSLPAKGSLTNFLQGLINLRLSDFTVIYDYITDYEASITENNNFDEDETETILTVTSISRYSLYSETQRKDKDWNLSAGNKPVKRFFSGNDVAIISIIALLQKIL